MLHHTDELIPYDGVPREEIVTIHPAVTSVYIILASAGIVFAIACLIFNFVHRTAKYVKGTYYYPGADSIEHVS